MSASQHPLVSVAVINPFDPQIDFRSLRLVADGLAAIGHLLDAGLNPLLPPDMQRQLLQQALARTAGLAAYTQPWAQFEPLTAPQ